MADLPIPEWCCLLRALIPLLHPSATRQYWHRAEPPPLCWSSSPLSRQFDDDDELWQRPLHFPILSMNAFEYLPPKPSSLFPAFHAQWEGFFFHFKWLSSCYSLFFLPVVSATGSREALKCVTFKKKKKTAAFFVWEKPFGSFSWLQLDIMTKCWHWKQHVYQEGRGKRRPRTSFCNKTSPRRRELRHMESL